MATGIIILVQVTALISQPALTLCHGAVEQLASFGATLERDAAVTTIPLDPDCIAIQTWLVAGPLPSPEFPERPPGGPYREGFDKDFLTHLGGEAQARPRPGDMVLREDGETVTFEMRQWNDAYVELTQAFGQLRERCAYLYSELASETEQNVYLHVGTNDCGKVWLNGDLIVCHADDRPAHRSQNIVEVTLRPGRNHLLLKVGQAGAGWGVFVEVYGRASHQRFVLDNYPAYLDLLADNPTPATATTVHVRIGNWVPQDKNPDVTWLLDDGDSTQILAQTIPEVNVEIPDSGPRILRVLADCPHPRGGVVSGECAILVNHNRVVDDVLARFAEVTRVVGDPLALTGAKRDAYALALYAVERHARNTAPNSPYLGNAHELSKAIGTLVSALDAFDADNDPFKGRTGRFEAAYLSRADGTAQPFMLHVPRDYGAGRTYALLVYLHGAGTTHEFVPVSYGCAADQPYASEVITVAVMGRGPSNGYRGLGENDVLEVIDWVSERYPVDPDRVYIYGDSMGGGGTWHIAAKYADRFAASMMNCGEPMLDPLPNFLNLPAYVNHGSVDWDVPVAWARLGVSVMREHGAPVVFNEYEGIPHSVATVVKPRGYMTRLSAHRRCTDPAHIRICAAHPRHAGLYWGRIARWDDPHETATLEARVLADNVVNVTLCNATAATLTPPAGRLDARKPITWLVNAKRVITEPSTTGCYDIFVDEGGPRVGSHTTEEPPTLRPYAPGSYMELYRGEPLIIVYGTRSNDMALNTAIKDMADALAHCCQPGDRMEFGRIPAVPDTDLTTELETTRNLFLLGGPSENAVTARLMRSLPIREVNQRLRIFDADPVSLSGRGYGFLYPAPDHPDRLVFIYASQEPGYYRLAEGFDNPGASAVLAGLWRDPYIPDLFIETASPDGESRLVDCTFFTHNWQPKPIPSMKPGSEPTSAAEFADMLAAVLRTVTSAPYALVQKGSPDEPSPYEPDTAGFDEILWLVPKSHIVSFKVKGGELSELARRLEAVDAIIAPSPDSTSPGPDTLYRVAAEPGIFWTLAGIEYTPQDLRFFDDSARIQEAVRDVWHTTLP